MTVKKKLVSWSHTILIMATERTPLIPFLEPQEFVEVFEEGRSNEEADQGVEDEVEKDEIEDDETMGNWKIPLFGCLQVKYLVPMGLLSCFFPGIPIAYVAESSNVMELYVVLSIFSLIYFMIAMIIVSQSPFLLASTIMYVGAIIAGTAVLRSKIRRAFEISGSFPLDLMAMMFCGSCAITQMAAQIEVFEPGACFPMIHKKLDVLLPYEKVEYPDDQA
jgi:Cys-rich protein (TIGR01571 family)